MCEQSSFRQFLDPWDAIHGDRLAYDVRRDGTRKELRDIGNFYRESNRAFDLIAVNLRRGNTQSCLDNRCGDESWRDELTRTLSLAHS